MGNGIQTKASGAGNGNLDPIVIHVFAEAEALYPLLVAIKASAPGVDVVLHDSLAKAVEAAGAHKVLIPLASPINGLAAELRAKGAVQRAVMAWTDRMARLLDQVQEYKGRCLIVPHEDMAPMSTEVLSKLRTHYALGVAPSAAQMISASDCSHSAESLVAAFLLATDPQARELGAKLEGLFERATPIKSGIERAEELLSEARDREVAIEKELTLLRERVASFEQQTNVRSDVGKTAEKPPVEPTPKTRDYELLVAQQQALHRLLEDQQRSNAEREASLGKRLLVVEREYFTAHSKAQHLQAEIDEMRRSRSWRITKPLRAIKAKTKG